MRLLFAGTPDVAVPTLQALIDSEHEVCAVLTRPDMRAGRGRTLRQSPVALAADQAGIQALKPTSLGDPEVLAQVEALNLDAAPVVAYGALVPPKLLAVPVHGWVNLHFSLLPAWRGAAPVQRAIMAGDDVTGATTFQLTEGLDTGPTLGRVTETLRDSDTAGDVLRRLSIAGAHLLVASLDALAAGTAHPQPQPHDGISHAPKLTPADAEIDWARPAYAVDRQIRGCTPEPGPFTTVDDRRLAVLRAELVDEPRTTQAHSRAEPRPGELLVSKREVLVGTTHGQIRLLRVQPQGKQGMDAADWARGARAASGDVLGGERTGARHV
ncbi:MAG: methionyl-tRNA formyltransferase [Ornithinimicrobium sp.]